MAMGRTRTALPRQTAVDGEPVKTSPETSLPDGPAPAAVTPAPDVEDDEPDEDDVHQPCPDFCP